MPILYPTLCAGLGGVLEIRRGGIPASCTAPRSGGWARYAPNFDGLKKFVYLQLNYNMRQDDTTYYLYLDECGDQNLASFDSSFPIFTLCGVLVSENRLSDFENEINSIKREFWDDNVIFHSREIRKHQKRFVNLNDTTIKNQFYSRINSLLSQKGVYVVVCCAVPKIPCIEKFGCEIDIYGTALSYVLQRSIFYLDEVERNGKLRIIVEKRGKREDRNLRDYYNRILETGVKYCSEERMKSHIHNFNFSAKSENINGLQIADLIAYPLSRHVLYPDKDNPAFDIVEPNIYVSEGKRLGLKVFPD